MEHSIRKCATIAAVLALCSLAPVSSVMAQNIIQPGPTQAILGPNGKPIVVPGSPTPGVITGPTVQLNPNFYQNPAAAGRQVPSVGIPPVPPGVDPSSVTLIQLADGKYMWMGKQKPLTVVPLKPTTRWVLDAQGRLVPAPPPPPLSTPAPLPRPLPGPLPPTNAPSPPTAPGCAASTSGATMFPCVGPTGTPIQVQVSGGLTAAPLILSFKAVVSRGVPARLQARLLGSGLTYSTPAPVQLCIAGGGTWEAELVLANGQNVGTIGSYTPTNCP